MKSRLSDAIFLACMAFVLPHLAGCSLAVVTPKLAVEARLLTAPTFTTAKVGAVEVMGAASYSDSRATVDVVHGVGLAVLEHFTGSK